MPAVLQLIISKELSATGCSRLLAGDGITTMDFTLKTVGGVYTGVSLDARGATKSIPALGKVMSTAKNLDEYYYKICNMVRPLPDSDVKISLQKYRIGIVACFSSLSELLSQKRYDGLDEWDRNAKTLLDGAIEVFISATNPKLKPRVKAGNAMEFFGIPEMTIESSLRSFYGMD